MWFIGKPIKNLTNLPIGGKSRTKFFSLFPKKFPISDKLYLNYEKFKGIYVLPTFCPGKCVFKCIGVILKGQISGQGLHGSDHKYGNGYTDKNHRRTQGKHQVLLLPE